MRPFKPHHFRRDDKLVSLLDVFIPWNDAGQYIKQFKILLPLETLQKEVHVQLLCKYASSEMLLVWEEGLIFTLFYSSSVHFKKVQVMSRV